MCIMTNNQKARLSADLEKIAGEPVTNLFDYHDSFSVSFASELGALRVANRYAAKAGLVKPNGGPAGIGTFGVEIKTGI